MLVFLLLRPGLRSGLLRRGGRRRRWRRGNEDVLDRELLAGADGEIDHQRLQRAAADLDHVLTRGELDPLERRRNSLGGAVSGDLAFGFGVESCAGWRVVAGAGGRGL